ncbi:CtsR family transcriptional regulator [Desulfuribacillus alkaliarsenatis]|uniref:Transcriptional regulator CtsR n=1 Tax=Desulfuribacillus alkaliarsenatis TaxID=766136 RepID=A0A1E5G4F5_9FIRM|nr:CtsR family transcriptional regulator [Desulfuribacillus alkaliarsenatis]OEF97972.1 transcriptional regulator [Desulfuribacillus alkaliarsenatis]
MLSVSNIIEKHIKELFLKSNVSMIEIKRNEMADRFDCAPSQINYVMQTRFSLEKGYIVKSKRGGGGFIRIQKIDIPKQRSLHRAVMQFVGEEASQEQSLGIIQRLHDERVITNREKQMLKAAMSRDVLGDDVAFKNKFRAKLLGAMFSAILGKDL